MSRLLGIDYGDQRIGLSVCDAAGRLASPLSTFVHKGWGPSARQVAKVLQEQSCAYVVLGLPLSMDGTQSRQTFKVLGFADRLRSLGIRVELFDERLSTVSAQQLLQEGGHSTKAAKARVDQAAAALILQAYLDQQNPEQSGIMQMGSQHAARAQTQETRSQEDSKMDMDKSKDIEEMEEEGLGLVELTDEDGNTTAFEYLTTLEHKGESFVVLLAPPEDGEEDEDEGEVVILKIARDDQGEDIYVSCDDEELEQEVFELFMEELDEEDDLDQE